MRSTSPFFWACLLLLCVVAGCNTWSSGWESGVETYDPGTACPDELELRVLLPATAPGRRQIWLMHNQLPDDAQALFDSDEVQGSWRPLSAAEAGQAGVVVDGRPVWAFVDDGTPPCRMIPGQVWAIRDPIATDQIQIATEMTGECHLGWSRHHAYAVQTDQRPYQCYWKPSRAIGSSASDDVPEVEFPEPFAGALDPTGCQAPDCQRQWHLNGNEFSSGLSVYELTVSRSTSRLGESGASRAVTDLYAIFHRGGETQKLLGWSQTGGYEGAVYDVQGVRALVTNESGVISIHGPPPNEEGAPEVSGTIKWRHAKEGEFVLRSVWP